MLYAGKMCAHTWDGELYFFRIIVCWLVLWSEKRRENWLIIRWNLFRNRRVFHVMVFFSSTACEILCRDCSAYISSGILLFSLIFIRCSLSNVLGDFPPALPPLAASSLHLLAQVDIVLALFRHYNLKTIIFSDKWIFRLSLECFSLFAPPQAIFGRYHNRRSTQWPNRVNEPKKKRDGKWFVEKPAHTWRS